jgi:hypothetical protein
MPVTTPEAEIVPTEGTLLTHTPPTEVSANGVVAPTQTVNVPVMGPTTGVTKCVTVKLELLTLKNTLPLPLTFILAVEDVAGGLGIVTLALPLLGKVPIV